MIKYSIKIFTLRFMYTLFYLHFKLQVKHIIYRAWSIIYLGTIKNIILYWIANKKLDNVGNSVTEEKESSLRDTNA